MSVEVFLILLAEKLAIEYIPKVLAGSITAVSRKLEPVIE